MTHAATPGAQMVEIWRGSFLESQHVGHAVVCDTSGQIVEAWGDPNLVMLPRSSSKMLQALPLIETGAAKACGLGAEHLALSCASHDGAAIHTDRVTAWLSHIGMNDDAFRCGPQEPGNDAARHALIRAGQKPRQCHNNCSGKHAGFLTLAQHLNAGPEYLEPSHPVQKAVLETFEDMTGQASPGHAIDGCSAPNHATSMTGFARAMARMAKGDDGTVRGRAAAELTRAMAAHPDLVAGEGRACTELMRAMDHKVAIKTGAEAVFAAILPDQKLGIAVKIADGATRAAECVIAGLLVKYGALNPDHPAAQKRLTGPITNWREITTGRMRLTAGLLPP